MSHGHSETLENEVNCVALIDYASNVGTVQHCSKSTSETCTLDSGQAASLQLPKQSKVINPDIQAVVMTNDSEMKQPQKVASMHASHISISILTKSGALPGDQSSEEKQLLEKEKPFKCSMCSERFLSKGNLTRHGLVHTVRVKESDDGFTCDECGRHFLQQCDLNRHRLIHTRSQPHKCHLCENAYIRRSDLVTHLRFHNKQKVFQCEHCTKSFCQSGDLRRHIRCVHLKQKKLLCGLCPRKYVSEKTLLRHMQIAHGEDIIKSLNS